MEVKKIAVIGAGIMGSGIAQACAQAGFSVAMRDIGQDFVDRGFKGIGKSLDKLVEKQKISAEDRQAIVGRIKGVLDLAEAIKDANVVIEAVSENMDIKKALFKEMDGIADKDSILASNTTALSISEMGGVTKRADKVIGMHFFNPAPVMGLVEIIRSLATSDETHNTIVELTKKLGKRPISIKESPGFVVTRIFAVLINEAFYTLMDGVAPAQDIDEAMRLGVNLPMGPLATADFMGLDIALATMETLYREFGDPKYRPCPLIRQYVRAGWLGVKTGRGVYDYSKR